jgi:TPR repeat protein
MAMRKLFTALMLIVSMGVTGAVCAQDSEKAYKAYEAKDYATAMKEWRYLAERGDVRAQYRLGLLYTRSPAVIQDYKEAAIWFRKAAEQGSAAAQSDLASKYYFGAGVIQDNVYAHMWYNIASSNGAEKAGDRRDELAKKMTAADISKAQELARECVKKLYKGC